MNKRIAVIVGSLRKNSYSQQLANNLVDLLPEGYDAEFIQIGQLPLYNQDYDNTPADTPQEYIDFRNQMRNFDAVIFVTPEHNRTVPAALKNALDVGSRPKKDSVWYGKPALVASQSPGSISGFGANHVIRQSLTFLNMPTLQQPEVYIAHTDKLLDENGKINNEGTVAFLQTVIDAFVEMVKLYTDVPEKEATF